LQAVRRANAIKRFDGGVEIAMLFAQTLDLAADFLAFGVRKLLVRHPTRLMIRMTT
jgi:hypothetical protein